MLRARFRSALHRLGSARRPRLAKHHLLTDAGQASVDYLVVVGLVAVVLGTVGAITAGPAITNRVGEAIQRGICIVTGDKCEAIERKPCVVRTVGRDLNASVHVAILKVGKSVTVLRQEYSDGTVDITYLDNLQVGAILREGAEGRIMIGKRELGGGRFAQVSAIAQLGGGRIWHLRDGAAANDLVSKLKEYTVGRAVDGGVGNLPGTSLLSRGLQHLAHRGSGVRLPAETTRVDEAKITAEGEGRGILRGGLGAAIGSSTDVATGGHSYYFALDGTAAAALLGGLLDLNVKGKAKLAVSYDRHGRPLGLDVSAEGKGSGNLDLPVPQERPIKKSAGLTGGFAASSHLDLTDPEDQAVVNRMLDSLDPGHWGDLLPAARALGQRISASTRMDITIYRGGSTSRGGELDVSAAAGLGAGMESKRTTSNLVAAWTRPAGGFWESRDDCLQA